MQKQYVPVARNHWLKDFFDDDVRSFLTHPTEGHSWLSHTPYNVEETDQYHRLSLDVPGIDPKNIQVKVKENILSVSAKEDTTDKNTKRQRTLDTSFSLPAYVDASKIEANIENGVMDIVLPKKKESQVKEISVQGGSATGFLDKVKKQLTKNH